MHFLSDPILTKQGIDFAASFRVQFENYHISCQREDVSADSEKYFERAVDSILIMRAGSNKP